MWTKRQIIAEAFAELALAGYVFDLQPEEIQGALRRLDMMMALWEAEGVRVGYAFSADPSSADPDQASGLPDSAVEPVSLNLAIRIAAGKGKQIGSGTRKTAAEGLALLMRAAAMPQEQQLPNTMPLGAGNRSWGSGSVQFFPSPDESPLGITQGGDLNIFPE